MISRKESDRRLEVLAAVLDKVEPERFNFSHWVGEEWEGKPDLSCGTTACGMGWACTIPEFQDLGLELRRRKYVRNMAYPAIRGHHEVLWHDNTWFAGQEIFGINKNQFTHLFTYDYDLYREGAVALRGLADTPVVGSDDDVLASRDAIPVSAQQLAAHIRRFIEWRKTQPEDPPSPFATFGISVPTEGTAGGMYSDAGEDDDDEDDGGLGELMTIEQYRADVRDGSFIDYDGSGVAMQLDGNGQIVGEKVSTYPSIVDQLPEHITHVRWFNR